MKIAIKKLSPELCEDYLYFFDNVAFSDHSEWHLCYCLEGHLTEKENDELTEREDRRQKVRELIGAGTLNGYLLYDEEKVVGWCNCGDKLDYKRVKDEFFTSDAKRGEIKIIYCITIAPEYRGKGLSHLLIQRFCVDAAEEGYLYAEAYPFTDREFRYQYHGPMGLYNSHGFKVYEMRDWYAVMRKSLK